MFLTIKEQVLLKKRLILCSLYNKKTTKMSIIISNGDLNEAIKKEKLESKEEVLVSNNVDGKANKNVDELVIDSEADKFLVLFEKIFNEKLIEQENIAKDSDAEDGAIQDILIRIANKISEKISTGENKTLKLLKLISFFFKSFANNGKDKSGLSETAQQ